MDKRTIAVIFGGCSPEYPVSLEGSNAVISNLDREKYDLVLKALKPDGYEKMSLAEFNRKTHAALSEYDEIMDISYLY